MKITFSSLLLVIALIPNAFAAQVSKTANLEVLRPGSYDGHTCDRTVFDGSLQSLSPSQGLLASASSTLKLGLVGRPDTLELKLLQAGSTTAVIHIEGHKENLKTIQNALSANDSVKLTEYSNCLDTDPSLILIENITFSPQLPESQVHLDAQIEVVRSDTQGDCKTKVSRSFAEFILNKNPNVDLSKVSSEVTVFSNIFSPSGEVLGKKVTIQFSVTKGNLTGPVGPSITIDLPSELVDFALETLRQPGGRLKVTGMAECKNLKADDPFWITNLIIQ